MKNVNYIEDPEKWKSEFSYFIPIKTKFSETDAFGHINSGSPFIYFEDARIDFFNEVGVELDKSKSNAIIPVAADLQCDFHRQVYFGVQLKVYVKANHIGTTSMDLHYMAINENEEVCFTGRGRIVLINFDTGKPAKIPLYMVEKLKLIGK